MFERSLLGYHEHGNYLGEWREPIGLPEVLARLKDVRKFCVFPSGHFEVTLNDREAPYRIGNLGSDLTIKTKSDFEVDISDCATVEDILGAVAVQQSVQLALE